MEDSIWRKVSKVIEKIYLKIIILENSHVNRILSGSIILDIANCISCLNINNCHTLVSILKSSSYEVASLSKLHSYSDNDSSISEE